MAMKKIMSSKEGPVVLSENKNSFPPGYRFILGSMTCTIRKRLYEDNTEMRELVDTRGDVQIVTLATLMKDAQEPDFTEIEPVPMPRIA